MARLPLFTACKQFWVKNMNILLDIPIIIIIIIPIIRENILNKTQTKKHKDFKFWLGCIVLAVLSQILAANPCLSFLELGSCNSMMANTCSQP